MNLLEIHKILIFKKYQYFMNLLEIHKILIFLRNINIL